MPGPEVAVNARAPFQAAPDYPFGEEAVFDGEAFPRSYFIEHRYAGDPTNWWIPNTACVTALLRSAGFIIRLQPEDEVFICGRDASAGKLEV